MPERARFRLVFESIDVGALFYDPAGRILDANRIARETLGLSLDPAAPLPALQDVFPRLQIRGSDGRMVPFEELPSQRALRSGAPVAATLLQSPDANGQLRWINAAAFPMVDEADRVTEVFLTLYDVTERRRLEEQVVQGQKMEAIGTLAGGIAHDFNNLLTIITGYAELLRDRLIDDADAVSDADALLQASRSGSTLTRQILAFSRKQVLLPVVIELGEFLEHLKPILTRLLGEDISLLLVRTTPSVRIKVDRSQLEQIVLNLAANARDAMRTGGQLTLQVAVATLTRRTLRFSYEIPPGRYAVLSAMDTGIGMDAAT